MSVERAKNGAAVLEAFAATTAATRASVVAFERAGAQRALGTVVDQTGLTLTKASEVGTGLLQCRLPGGEVVDALVLATDEDSDLALVKVAATQLKPITWSTNEASIGHWAVTPGIGLLPEAVGVLSAAPRRIRAKRAVIGVLPDFESSAALIKAVQPGYGAEKAGLVKGDVVLSVNGARVTNSDQLVNTLRQYRVGQTVHLGVRRAEREFEVEVLMGAPRPPRGDRGSDRQDRINRLGTEISARAEGFALALQHDTVLQPWQCGGPLVDVDGRTLGINIARAGRIASYALPTRLIQKVLSELRRRANL